MLYGPRNGCRHGLPWTARALDPRSGGRSAHWLDIRIALEDAGAHVTATTTVRHALILVEHNDSTLAAAITDHALADGDSTELCTRLTARGIPYVRYSGFNNPVEGVSPAAPFLGKPASMDELLGAVEKLLIGR